MRLVAPFRHVLSSIGAHRLLALAFALPVAALAQMPRDDIDRNLQERAAREREFHVDLDAPAPSLVPPSPTLERSRVMVRTPGTELFDVPSRRAAPPSEAARSTVPRAAGPSQLDENQRRRQLGLQSQTRFLDETQRRPQLDAQQLQFDQEQRADQVHSDIMRNSERAMRGR